MKKSSYWLIPLFALLTFGSLYIYNLSGWLMDDDEGTDFYEAWQLSEQKIPGEDFLPEQQPLFILSGKALIDQYGRDPLPLRLLAVSQVLLGAFVLVWAVWQIWNGKTAIFTLIFLLFNGMVYQQARLYRPDPMMFAWGMMGLAAALWAVHSKNKMWWAVSGFLYGISILWKPFGIFPVVGLLFYFLCWLWQHKQEWKSIIKTGILFSMPFLLISIGITVLLYSRMGFYYQEAFGHHLALGAQNGFLHRLMIASSNYLFFLLLNGVSFLFIVPFWWISGRPSLAKQSPTQLLVLQLLSPLIFLAISRPLHLRYFLYLVAPLAILLARQIDVAWQNMAVKKALPIWLRATIIGSLATVAIFLSRPNILTLMMQYERGTIALAEYVASYTDPEDIILSDYAGINFFANRESIYEASIIAGGRIDGGIITGKLLIERIESSDVKMVLIHVDGGHPPPHQLVNLVDYSTFEVYLADNFHESVLFNRDRQIIEIYRRKD